MPKDTVHRIHLSNLEMGEEDALIAHYKCLSKNYSKAERDPVIQYSIFIRTKLSIMWNFAVFTLQHC